MMTLLFTSFPFNSAQASIEIRSTLTTETKNSVRTLPTIRALVNRFFFGIIAAMKVCLALLLCVVLLSPAAADPLAYPQRIVSLGLCTDQLLLMMVEHDRIASLTHSSIDKKMSYMAEYVGDIPLNHASVEEIIPFQPDLIVGSAYAAQDTVRFLRLLGYEVKLISLPRSVAEVRSHLREFATWLGREQQAEKLITDMDITILDAQQRNAHKSEKSVVIYSPNGYTIGSDTLENDVLIHAGFRNLSATGGIQGFTKVSLETLVATRPDYLQIDNHVYNANSLASAYIHHPVLDRMLPAEKRLFIPSRLRACAGPTAAEAIAYLADRR